MRVRFRVASGPEGVNGKRIIASHVCVSCDDRSACCASNEHHVFNCCPTCAANPGTHSPDCDEQWSYTQPLMLDELRPGDEILVAALKDEYPEGTDPVAVWNTGAPDWVIRKMPGRLASFDFLLSIVVRHLGAGRYSVAPRLFNGIEYTGRPT